MEFSLQKLNQIFNTLPDWEAMQRLLDKLAKAYAHRFNVDVFEFVWKSDAGYGMQWIPLGRHINYSQTTPVFSPPHWKTGLFSMAYDEESPLLVTNLKALASGTIDEVEEFFTKNTIKKDEYYTGHKDTEEEIVIPMMVKENVVGLINIESFKKGKLDTNTVKELSGIASHLARIIDAAEYDKDRREEISKYVNELDFGSVKQAILGHQCFLARPFSKEFVGVEDKLVDVAKNLGLNVQIVKPNPKNMSIFHDIIDQISGSIFSIVDVTYLKANVLIELGIIIGGNKPMLIIQDASDNTKLPFDIQSIPIYRYHRIEESSGRCKIELEESFLNEFEVMFNEHKIP